MVSPYLKSQEFYRFVFSNTGLCPGNPHLLFDSVYPFQIRQEKTAPAAAFDNDPVSFRIKGALGLGYDRLRSGKNIDRDIGLPEFRECERHKTGVPCCSR